ncbi:hypothetical protein CEXT_803911 [Caerostris extrusa]|uniref:Uncharacterized protein n=1 Tax=Caerostris extrusa TaxID=172846 RepID=A0AAV4Y0F3_CAEEX|nr:hypothetical protein CEXT_803911 [Caerostris extrusa]
MDDREVVAEELKELLKLYSRKTKVNISTDDEDGKKEQMLRQRAGVLSPPLITPQRCQRCRQDLCLVWFHCHIDADSLTGEISLSRPGFRQKYRQGDLLPPQPIT